MNGEKPILGNSWRAIAVALFFTFSISPLTTFHLSTPLPAQCGVKVKPADIASFNDAVKNITGGNQRDGAAKMRRLAARNTKAADPQFWLGIAAASDGNVTGIRRYFSRCIELCPSYPDPRAHYYMGVIHYTDNRYDDAVRELEKYFSLSSGNPDRAIGALYEEASNYLYWSQFLAEATLNMAPFDPKRLDAVSTSNDEALPYLSPAGNEIYFLRQVPVSQRRTYYTPEEQQKQWKLFVSTWKDTAFSSGTPLPSPFNSGDPEGNVSLTADGSELYYSIIRPVRGYANSDIYRVRRSNGKWQKAENLGPLINGDGSWESQPAVSADGTLLIFASNRKGGLGGIDLWRCHRLPNGDWSRPENLGPAVNTAGNDKMPFLAADGHTLYFLSNGWQGFGGYDIYFSDLNDPHGNRPTNLGLPINTEGDEVSFCVSPDGSQAFFAGRVDGSTSIDILQFDLYPAARPEAMRLCHVTLQGPAATRDTTLMLREQTTNVVSLCSSESLPAIFCLRARQMPKTVSINDTLTPLNISFLPGSRLSDDGERIADALAQWLIAHPRISLAIECPKQTDARTVYDHLRRSGLRAERLSYRGGTDIPHPQIRLIKP